MEKQEVGLAELQRLAARMADELQALDCPQCCGPVYPFIESGAQLYYEEMEWACVALVLVNCNAGPKRS